MIDVDVLIVDREHMVSARSVLQHGLAVVGRTRAEVMDQMTALLATDPHVHGVWHRRRPVLRVLRPVLPSSYMGRMMELPLHLAAIFYQHEDAPDEVYLADLDVWFETQDLADAERLSAEHLRERFPLNTRHEHLLRYTRPVDIGANGPPVPPDAPTQGVMSLERVRVRRTAQRSEEAEAAVATPMLTAVGDPLHRMMRRKDAARAFDRDAEVELLLDCLAGSRQRSALLVGPSGAGKTAIVHDAVRRMVRREASPNLHNVPVWRITGGRLVAGARFPGQWQERVLGMIDEARRTGAVLFVEDLVELLSTSGALGGERGVGGVLLPHLLADEIALIAELRPEQVALAEQHHPNLVHALRRIPVLSMNPAQTDSVLEQVSYRLGRSEGARLEVNARQKIIELTTRFAGDASGQAALPGEAVRLAERCVRTHIEQARKAEGERYPALGPAQITAAYAAQTGMPAALLDPDVAFSAEEVRAHFTDQVFAQPEAVDALVELVTVVRAGLNDPRRPLSSLLLIGPTGVGKTQTALALAQYLFGSTERLIRLDMSEYQDAWAAARLAGRGQGDPGVLTQRLREQPFQVVLLDEIEKADPAVFDVLLQLLGEGRLTDGFGQTASLRNAVVIMTSNLGAGGPSTLGFGAGADEEADTARAVQRNAAHYRSAIGRFFRPELVGRIDRVIPYRPLGAETARRLVDRAVEEVLARPGLLRRGITARIDEAVLQHVIRRGFDARYGARPLRQTVEQEITARLATALVDDPSLRDTTIRLSLRRGEVVARPV